MEKYQIGLENVAVGLYLSGSVYGYERSKGLCWNGTVEEGGQYGVECPIYVNEGSPILGPLDQDDPHKGNQSQFRSYSTGFGLMTL